MDIVLTTLNAKYIHAAFGLRYLLANLGSLQERACIAEFEINQRPLDIAEVLLARDPKIIGFGVYIWNVAETTKLVAALKRVRPDLQIILGGPEVSYETDEQEIVALADYVITGEADLAFAELCEKVLDGRKPLMKVIPAELPEFEAKASNKILIRIPQSEIRNHRCPPVINNPISSLVTVFGSTSLTILP